MPIRDLEKLPAIQWPLPNIKKIPASKNEKFRDNLRKVLGL